MKKAEQVKAHFMRGDVLTPAEAYDKYKTMRLGAIVFDLKKRGMNIVNEQTKWGTKYAVYRLAKE